MRMVLGAGMHRIELELARGCVWYRLPFIGQGHWTTDTGWTVDGWAEVRHEGSQL